MINIPETYQIIILVIVLLLLGYYALVLNKKVEGFGWSGIGFVDDATDYVKSAAEKAADLAKDLANSLYDLIPKPWEIFDKIRDWINSHVVRPVSDLTSKIKDIPEEAKNKILGVLEKPISFVKNIVQNAKNVFIKVYNTVKGIITTVINFIKDELMPFFGDKVNVIKDLVMDKISPILEKTLSFVTGRLKKVWEVAINATGIPDMLQTGYYIALAFLGFGIFLNTYSIYNHLMTPVKCLECNCACD